ncbi:hypothetical protein ASE37_19005 [Rhizobium sp. Root268]|nr:hypothetical protein ASC86_18505 [Rhizobium sp. Root1212]KRD21612.1 hypothetical protein ASE37_19005 [Rhizobium sp. Root268]
MSVASQTVLVRATRAELFAAAGGFTSADLGQVTQDDNLAYRGVYKLGSSPVKIADLPADVAQDAAEDADGFRVAAAGSASSAATSATNSRLSEMSAAASQAVSQAAAQASGPVVFYDTKALADAAVSGLPANQIVEVFTDETKGGASTRYRKEGGVLVFKVAVGNLLRVVSFEALGGVGDGNYSTAAGTDNANAFALARTMGLLGYAVQFKTGAQYRTTAEIVIHDNMNWMGDDGYTPIIFADFATSSKRIVKAPTSGSQIKNVSIRGLTFWRCGANPEHGLLLDNIDGLFLDVAVRAVSGALGGAIGVSAFYPENRPSKNCYVYAHLEQAANFGIQYGNVDGGEMQVLSAKNCHREVVGLEPYALGKYDFTSSNVASDIISLTSHGLSTGDPVIYDRNGNTAITNLASRAAYYFVIRVDSGRIRLAATREDAMAGTYLTLSAPSGTHRLYRCGVLRGITVLPTQIATGDTAAGGTSTGVVIIAASSGGYHEGITLCAQGIIERNPTSGSHGIGVYGAHGVSILGADITGAKSRAISIVAGTVNSIRDATGDISPTNALQVNADVTVIAVNAKEFGTAGIYVDNSRCIVELCDLRSAVSGAKGIVFTAAAENLGSIARLNKALCPNTSGSPFTVVKGLQNIDLNDFGTIVDDYIARRLQSGYSVKTLAGASVTLGSLKNQASNTTTYMGKITVLSRQSDLNSANNARYELAISKPNSGATPTVAVLNSQGLTAGGGTSHPSFTFSIVGDDLVATPVASTSTSLTFMHFIETHGDLRLT